MKPKAKRAIKKHDRLEDLFLYEQDALDPPERAELEAHLKSCAGCQRELESVRRFIPALDKALIPDESSPKDLLASAKREMAKKQRGSAQAGNARTAISKPLKSQASRRVGKHISVTGFLAYAQDFLDPHKRAKTEAHLKSCPDCGKELLRIERFLRDMQQALTPKEISSEEMLARAMREIEARKRHSSPQDLRLYEQGLLDRPERAGFEVHLKSCADCQRELARVRRSLPKG